MLKTQNPMFVSKVESTITPDCGIKTVLGATAAGGVVGGALLYAGGTILAATGWGLLAAGIVAVAFC
ncbi:hypothetical protein [Gemmatimonas sp.]|jgi:hypothetical protein|uniref:hypothetical protein n=1 Tax=Gemmatimonas sp. TaxID=1962908 RepID=UPI0037BE4D82